MRTWNQFVESMNLVENIDIASRLVAEMLWDKYGEMFGDPVRFTRYIKDNVLKSPEANQMIQQANVDPQRAKVRLAAIIDSELSSEKAYSPAGDTGIGGQSQFGR